MSTPHTKLFWLNLLVIILGSIFLSWYYFVDGKIINKPLEYINGVDPLNLQLEKDIYRVGETPEALTAFCKTRPSSGTVEWTLIDGQRVLYGEHERRSIPVGCYPESGEYVRTEIEKIPVYIENTCDAYFVGVGKVTISGDRTVEYKYKTEKFCIEGADLLKIVE